MQIITVGKTLARKWSSFQEMRLALDWATTIRQCRTNNV